MRKRRTGFFARVGKTEVGSITVPIDLPGLDSEGPTLVFTQTKKESIAWRSSELMKLIEHTDISQEGLSNYTDPKRGFLWRENRDRGRTYYQDGADFFRGTTLGELVVAAIVNQGEIVVPPTIGLPRFATTQVTDSSEGAKEYAEEYSTAISAALFIAEALGLPQEKVKGSILMSPVIARIKTRDDNPVLRYPDGSYFATKFPVDIKEEVTKQCLKDITRWSHINILQFVTVLDQH